MVSSGMAIQIYRRSILQDAINRLLPEEFQVVSQIAKKNWSPFLPNLIIRLISPVNMLYSFHPLLGLILNLLAIGQNLRELLQEFLSLLQQIVFAANQLLLFRELFLLFNQCYNPLGYLLVNKLVLLLQLRLLIPVYKLKSFQTLIGGNN